MNTTWYDRVVEKGRRETLREMLEDRFGVLSPHAEERLQQMPLEQLKCLGKLLLQGASLQQLGLED